MCHKRETPDGKPDFSALLSYGNEAVMLEKLMTETEKEMQTIREAATEKDLQKLDSLTHHLRSSWEVLRADQPLNVLYRICFFLQKQVLCGVFCKSKTENSEKNKTYYTR